MCLHNQLSFFNSIIVQMSEKRVYQVDNGMESEEAIESSSRSNFSVTFTAKLE